MDAYNDRSRGTHLWQRSRVPKRFLSVSQSSIDELTYLYNVFLQSEILTPYPNIQCNNIEPRVHVTLPVPVRAFYTCTFKCMYNLDVGIHLMIFFGTLATYTHVDLYTALLHVPSRTVTNKTTQRWTMNARNESHCVWPKASPSRRSVNNNRYILWKAKQVAFTKEE